MADTSPPDSAPEYEARSDIDPWEDADWIPSDAKILLPHDELMELLIATPISTIAIDDPIFIEPGATMRQALSRMRQHHVRALLVMEGDTLVGIVTDRDAVLNVEPGTTGEAIIVRDVMTPDPITVEPDDPVGKAAQRICVDGVHHLPIVDGGQVVGIVATGRLLHSIIPVIVGDDA